MIRAALACLLGLAACDDPSCILEDVIIDRFGGAGSTAINCGHFNYFNPSETLIAGQQCTLDSSATQTPHFVIVEEIMGYEGRWAFAFLGMFEGGEWRDYYMHQAAAPDGRPITNTYACSSLTAMVGCTMYGERLCITCADSAVADVCSAD